MQLQNGILDVETIENTGQIAFSINNGINGDGLNVPNIKTQLEPASGSGPFMPMTMGCPTLTSPRPRATEKASTMNVSPGIYSLTFLNISPNCTPMLGWVPSAIHHSRYLPTGSRTSELNALMMTVPKNYPEPGCRATSTGSDRVSPLKQLVESKPKAPVARRNCRSRAAPRYFFNINTHRFSSPERRRAADLVPTVAKCDIRLQGRTFFTPI